MEFTADLKKRLLVCLFVAAAGFFVLVAGYQAGLGAALLNLALAGLLVFFVRSHREQLRPGPLWQLVPILLLSAVFVLRSDPLLLVFNGLVLFGLWLFLLLSLCGEWRAGRSWFELAVKLILAAATPFSYVARPFQWAAARFKKGKTPVLRVALALLVTLPLAVIVIQALGKADAIFYNTVGSWVERLTQYIRLQTVGHLLLSLVFGLFALGALCNLVNPGRATLEVPGVRPPALDNLAANIGLSALTLIYAIFCAIQFAFLFARSPLPYGLTYAEYARQGFFDLLGLSVLNFSVMLIGIGFRRAGEDGKMPRGDKLRRGLLLLLCAETLVLTVSSFYRMWCYEQAYGYTTLRILVYAFLIFEMICLLLFALHILRPMKSILLPCLWAGVAIYIGLCFMGLDQTIARRNIDRYLAGGNLDVYYLCELSSEASPELVRLLGDSDPEVSGVIRERLVNHSRYLQGEYGRREGFQEYNLAWERAVAAIPAEIHEEARLKAETRDMELWEEADDSRVRAGT